MACASDFRSFLECFHQSIVDDLNVNSLLPILVSKAIISNSERDQFLTNDKTNEAKAEVIFTILLQRGPTLFSRFISGLQEDGQDQHKELALKLVQGQSMYTSVTPRPPPRAKKRDYHSHDILESYGDINAACRLTGIKPLDQQLGHGPYGKVFTVEFSGSFCAAKEIHPSLLQNIESEERMQKLKNDFIKECYHCSNLIHPNIVQCLGVYYPTEHSFPVRVSELMDMSLPIYMERSNISYLIRISILNDVARGLSFLHTLNPPIPHCDLFPNNILLKYTRNEMFPVAKIADLGVAKVMQADGESRHILCSEMPETPLYMPPEAFDPASSNTSSRMQIDVFSFGGISLFVFSDIVALPIPPMKADLETCQTTLITEDVELHRACSSVLKGNYSLSALIELKAVIKNCMCYHPENRPPITTVSATIKDLMINHTDDKLRTQALKTKLVTMVCDAEEILMEFDNRIQEAQQKMNSNALLKVTNSDVDKPADNGNITLQLKKCKDSLKHYYLNCPSQKFSTGWPRLGDPTLYVDVTIVEAQSFSRRKNDVCQRFQKLWEEYAISPLNKKADFHSVSIEKLLLDRKGEVILIEGDGGCGKTTLALQICKQWAKGELLSKKEFLILVPLRHYESVTSTEKLFDKINFPVPEMKEYVQQNNGEGLVLIFDGWDELPNQLRSSSFFHDIIFSKNKTFIHSTILVTSRPTCSGDIAKVVDERKYEVLGFSPQEVAMYIEKHFGDDFKSAELLLCLLKNHQSLHHNFYIPITVAMMCFVYQHNGGQIPKTLSKLYEQFVIACFCSSIPYSCFQYTKRFISFSTVPKQLKLAFSELCKTAFITLKDKKLVFGEQKLHLTKESTENLHFDGFGLLHIDHYTNEPGTTEKSYSFIHLAVQEILAAIFISDTGNASEILDECFNEDSGLINVFPFLFGLVSKEFLRPLVGKLMQIYNRNDLLLSSILCCLFEAHDETLCCEFGQVFSEKRDVYLRLYTLLECHYAYYFLSVCGCNKLNVSIFHDLFGLSADLCFEIMAKYLCNTSIDIASFQCTIGTISHKGIEHFTKVLSIQRNLLSVKLCSFSPCDPDCVTTFCDSICKYNPQITHLTLPPTTLNGNYIEMVGYILANCLCLESLDMNCPPSEMEGMYLDSSVNFCKALCETKSLQTLILHGWNLSQADSEVFGNILSQNCSLREVCVNVATADCLDPILNGLFINVTTTTFRAWPSKTSSSRSNTLGQCLQKCLTLNQSLSCIDFAWYKGKYVSWLSTQVSSICIGLCVNTTVVTLDISGCYIDTDACHAVCGMLSQNTTLQHLFLNPVHLEKIKAITMIDSCRANSILEVLSLVQWPPKNLLDQRENRFDFSAEQEIIRVLQKVDKSRRSQNRPFLTICWTYEDYDEVKKTRVDYDEVKKTRVDYDEVKKTRVDYDEVRKTRVDYDEVRKTRVDYDEVKKTRVGYDEVKKTRVDYDEVKKTRVGYDEVKKTRV